MNPKTLLTAFALSVFPFHPSQVEVHVLRISAAASLADVMKEINAVYEVPAAEEPPIIYPMAVVKESKKPAGAKRAFEKLGFLLLPEPPASRE